MPHTDSDTDQNHGHPHVRPVRFRPYVWTYAALVSLATASLVLSRVHLGGQPASLLIAAIKAGLVLWFFMDLAEQGASSRIAIVVALSLMLTLIGLMAVDVNTRHTFPAETSPPPSSQFYRR